jgi:hypothetical protein
MYSQDVGDQSRIGHAFIGDDDHIGVERCDAG